LRKDNDFHRVERTSPDILGERIERLRELFPEAFVEGELNLDRLHKAVDPPQNGSAQPERYSFTWAGKRDAIQLLQTSATGTLKPVREESLNFEDTRNVFIQGDNLEVLKLLYKPYFRRVKMVYIDPPYNTGSDLLYADDYADPLGAYLNATGQKDAEGRLVTSNPETSGRYHSSWLSMMYPRLFLARQVLMDDGVIFVSIDDHEFHNLRMLMNEVFGEENFLATFVWKRRSGAMDAVNSVSTDHEYVVCYGRNTVSLVGVERTFERYANADNDRRGPWIADNLSAAKPGGNTLYPIRDPETGYEYMPPKGRYWPYSPETMKRKIEEGRILFPGTPDGKPLYKRFKSEAKSPFRPVSTWISPSGRSNGARRIASEDASIVTLTSSINTEGTREIKELFGDKVFTYPKPASLLRSLVKQGTSGQDDIVLDFFAGSCTTAQAVMELNREDGGNRRFICVQLPEATGNPDYPTIAEIGKERIRRVSARMQKSCEDPSPTLDSGEKTEDLGMKVFELTSSQYKTWTEPAERDPAAYADQMAMFADPLIEGWDRETLIWETALREGFDLNSLIERVEGLTDNEVWTVTDGNRQFRVCLDDDLQWSTPRALGLGNEDLFVCRDSALDDEMAANLALQCRLKLI
jgi:adenine-specific DNA-methyltransferase